jgi:hypothetical protein
MPVQPTLSFLEGLHFRLAYLMTSLSNEDLEKTFIHPENNAAFKIKEIIGTYAWHGNHHCTHHQMKKQKAGNFRDYFQLSYIFCKMRQKGYRSIWARGYGITK